MPHMENVSGQQPTVTPPIGKKSTGIGVLFQIVALVFAVPAVAWGVFMVWATAFPPPCGDSSGFVGLGVIECWAVDLPIGLLALAIGLFVKKGSPRMRKICHVTAAVVLSLPIIASILLSRYHCP